jgi:hypothetical protein
VQGVAAGKGACVTLQLAECIVGAMPDTCAQGSFCSAAGLDGFGNCTSSCDLWANTGCSTNEGCYPSPSGPGCAGAGSGAVGSTCNFLNDCAPGLICNNTCKTLCDATHTCPNAGACTMFSNLPGGLGACP